MKKSLTEDRRKQMVQTLLKDGSIKVGESAEKFNVSTETIRKDIIFLEQQGLAKKSHGGALASNELLERPIAVKETEHMEMKTNIAIRALDLVPASGVILLDAGSTNFALAKQLSLMEDLTIFTNAVRVVDLLASTNNTVYSIGGLVRGSSKATIGEWAITQLDSLRVDVSFLGTDGFRNFNGPSTASYEENEFKKAVVRNSNQTVVLTDTSKFESTSLFKFCEWSDVSALICERPETAEKEALADQIRKDTKVIFC